MNELQVPMQFDRRHFLKSDSVLVRTALDLVSTHVADGEGESASCRLCGLRFPCPTVHHARQVVDAGGVKRAGDRVVGRRPDAVPDAVPDTVSDAVVPDAVPDVVVPDTVPGAASDVTADAVPQGAPDVEADRGSDPAAVMDPAAAIEDELPASDPVGVA